MTAREKPRFYRFDDFVIDAGRRQLLRRGAPVRLNPKTFELLMALVERHGDILTKEELLERVWPNQAVEEGNLTVHVSALRKAFGERRGENRYVITVPGRGYGFVAVFGPRDETAPAVVSRRRPALAAVAIGAALLLLTIAAVVAYRETHGPMAAGDDPAGEEATPFEATQLTAIGTVSSAALSHDGRRFAYVAFDRGKESLWIASVDGSSRKEILSPADVEYGPLAFDPAGTRLFYSARASLFSIGADGGPAEKVRDGVGPLFSLSPDGRQAAFVRQDPDRHTSSIVVADLGGPGGERVVSVVSSGHPFSHYAPAWSPDGQMLAVGEQVAGDSGYVIAIVRLADGTARPLHPRRWTELGAIAWLRDGGGIVFHAVGSDSDFDLWRLTYPSGELRKITSDLSRYGRATVSVSDGGDRLLAVRSEGTVSVWTAAAPALAAPARVTDRASGKLDGSAGLAWASDASIVYVSFFNNSSSLWTVAAAGGQARPLTSPGYDDRFPRATRDGRYIVFASNRGGGSAIWRIDADGRGLRRLTTSGQDDQPDVAPDGRWVFYTSSDRGAHAIWKISIDGGPPVPVVRDAAWPRVSPDGRLLACAVDGPADRSQLAVFSVRAGHVIGRFELPRTGRMNTGLQWTPDGTAIVYRDFGEGLWIQPLAGGPPHRMDGVPPRKLYGFSWSPDGRRFAMSYGDELRDVVLIRHVG